MIEVFGSFRILLRSFSVLYTINQNSSSIHVSPKHNTDSCLNWGIETNLMELTSLAHDAFGLKTQVDVFPANIQKAFDTADTHLFVRKLANFPVSYSFVLWVTSYLSNRTQYVKVGQTKSDPFIVISGVGQGTILGPLWFTIFFDDSIIFLPGVSYMNPD